MTILNKILKFIRNDTVDITEYNIQGLDEWQLMDQADVSVVGVLDDKIIQITRYAESEYESIYTDDHKRLALIDTIISILVDSSNLATANKMYKKDYLRHKSVLLETLYTLFGNSEMIASLEETVARLEQLEMIPRGSKREFMKKTPLSRWL